MSESLPFGLSHVDAPLAERLRGGLADVEDALYTAVRSDYPFVTEASSHLVAAGGKRFRPLLALVASQYGDPAAPGVVPGAVIVELTHLATLYHDDVMDEAPLRRGAPSANARWDNTIAILTGDFLFARAADIARLSNDPLTVANARGLSSQLDEFMQADQRIMSALEQRSSAGDAIATQLILGREIQLYNDLANNLVSLERSLQTAALQAWPYGFGSRFQDERRGTNPEELLAAAHAACFTMAFSFACDKAGFATTSVDTRATVRLVAEGEGALERLDGRHHRWSSAREWIG